MGLSKEKYCKRTTTYCTKQIILNQIETFYITFPLIKIYNTFKYSYA